MSAGRVGSTGPGPVTRRPAPAPPAAGALRSAVAALAAFALACAPAAAPVPPPAPDAGSGGAATSDVASRAASGFPTTAPVPGPAPSLRLPESTRRTLPNGLAVVYVSRPALPIVHATLVTRGGRSDAPAALPGLSAFVADLMDEGAGGRDALALAAALEALGASLRTGSGWDAIQVDLEVLRPRLPEALRLMADVVTKPDFPEQEIERKREELLTDLARARDEARAIAGNAFATLVFGADNPYGRLETRESAGAMRREDIVGFHDEYVKPGASTLVLVGDIVPSVVEPLVAEAFGSWQSGEVPPPVAPSAGEGAGTTLYLIDKPGAPQSEIRIGHPGVARTDPDYFPLLVLNTLLGGSFTSRLNSNLREEHGYSYGAFSSFSMLRGAGAFQASAAVVAEKTDSSVVEFFHELQRIRSEPVPSDELDRAKRYVALGLPRRFETTGGVADRLADLAVYEIDEDFYARYVPAVMAVTAEDVERVAREYVRPDRSVVVVVGDRATIEEGLRGLGIGPVEVRPAEEFVR